MMMNCSRAAETSAPVCVCASVCVHMGSLTYRKTAEEESNHTDLEKIVLEKKKEGEQGEERGTERQGSFQAEIAERGRAV